MDLLLPDNLVDLRLVDLRLDLRVPMDHLVGLPMDPKERRVGLLVGRLVDRLRMDRRVDLLVVADRLRIGQTDRDSEIAENLPGRKHQVFVHSHNPDRRVAVFLRSCLRSNLSCSVRLSRDRLG